MAERRTLKVVQNVHEWFASEDGKHYKGQTTQLDPIFDHVRYLDDKVNSAPKAGNKHGWSYVGDIPITWLVDWLSKQGCTLDQFARNDNGIKDQFKKWYFQREHHKLHARHGKRT